MSIGKIRQFLAAAFALAAGIVIIAIVAGVIGIDLPILGAIPRAIGIDPAAN